MLGVFETNALRAKDQIDDALGQRQLQAPMPMPQMQRPMMPQQPMQMPMAQPQMPMAQPQMPMQQPMQQPQMPMAPRFQEGGLATSIHSPQDYHERDIAFINTRNQRMRELAGREPYAKGGLAAAEEDALSDAELARAFYADQNNSAVIAEVNRRIEQKLLRRFGGDREAAQMFLRETSDPMSILVERFAKGGGAWTRKEGQNPEGGLNAKGRASLRAQGHDIKPPVSAKQAAKSPKAAARRKSFCARMGGMEGPMKDENGKPTRKALALRKWDCKAEGGAVGKPVWDKPRPDDLGKPKAFSAKKKASAKARAKAAGRPYPNLVDNLAVARKKGK